MYNAYEGCANALTAPPKVRPPSAPPPTHTVVWLMKSEKQTAISSSCQCVCVYTCRCQCVSVFTPVVVSVCALVLCVRFSEGALTLGHPYRAQVSI